MTSLAALAGIVFGVTGTQLAIGSVVFAAGMAGLLLDSITGGGHCSGSADARHATHCRAASCVEYRHNLLAAR